MNLSQLNQYLNETVTDAQGWVDRCNAVDDEAGLVANIATYIEILQLLAIEYGNIESARAKVHETVWSSSNGPLLMNANQSMREIVERTLKRLEIQQQIQHDTRSYRVATKSAFAAGISAAVAVIAIVLQTYHLFAEDKPVTATVDAPLPSQTIEVSEQTVTALLSAVSTHLNTTKTVDHAPKREGATQPPEPVSADELPAASRKTSTSEPSG